MMNKKILISGIYYEGGGLGKVLTNLVHHLSFHFEVDTLIFESKNKKMESNDRTVYSYPMGINSVYIPQDAEIIKSIVENNYSHIIILGPVWLNARLINQVKQFNSSIKIIAFIPYEGKVINLNHLDMLNQINFCIFYSKYIYDNYLELLKEHNIEKQYIEKLGYVSHGLETDTFYPLDCTRKKKKTIARKHIKEHEHLPHDAFIILNSNRPFYRKGIDTTLEAFQCFSSNKTICYLHLHLGNIGKNWVKEIKEKTQKYNLSDKVIFTHGIDNITRPDNWMNYLYNACDVGLSTSYGEGWGLGLFEHAATNAPIIAPKHTSFIENWENIGILTDIKESQFLFYENTEIYFPSVESIVMSLEKLYNSSNTYELYANQCYKYVTSGRYSWVNTANYFKQIINNHRIN